MDLDKIIDMNMQNSVTGKNILHYAVDSKNLNTLKAVLSFDCKYSTELINLPDHRGLTPLAYVILDLEKGQHDSKFVDELVKHGAKFYLPDLAWPPIFLAVRLNQLEIVKKFFESDDFSEIHELRNLDQETLLHFTNTKPMAAYLIEQEYFRLDPNLQNNYGNTALHTAIDNNFNQVAIYFILNRADANIVNKDNLSPLQLSVKKANLEVTRMLITFGANPRIGRNTDNAIYNLAHQIEDSENKQKILEALQQSGTYFISKNISVDGTSSSQGASSAHENYSRKVSKEFDTSVSEYIFPEDPEVEEYQNDTVRCKSLPKSLNSSPALKESPVPLRVLCLDGGGIRGLILAKILHALELEAKVPCHELFDVVAGTSTGAILAAMLCLKKPMEYILTSYFRLKDKVFVGPKPYDSEFLEKFLKVELGAETKMSDIQDHKLIITATLADRKPIDLFLFRSYEKLGGEDLRNFKKSVIPPDLDFEPMPLPADTPLWYAVRCSSAAPIFFRPKDRFMDGGCIANNPTLDVMEELHRYNKELKKLDLPTYKIDTLCSIGTGRKPLEKINPEDLDMPTFSVKNALSSGKDMLNKSKLVGGMMFTSLTHTEDYIVRRAEAWCEQVDIKYFRLNSSLPKRILLNEVDDEILLDILWDAQVWCNENRDVLKKLALRLLALRKVSRSEDAFT